MSCFWHVSRFSSKPHAALSLSPLAAVFASVAHRRRVSISLQINRMLSLRYTPSLMARRLELNNVYQNLNCMVVCCARGPRPRFPLVWKSRKRIGTISKPQKFVECIFADMEELDIRPDGSIVRMLGDVFQKLGMLDKYDKLKKKYPSSYVGISLYQRDAC